MAFKKIFVISIWLAVACRAGLVQPKPKDPLVAAYESLPESEKNDFLAYNLAQSVADVTYERGNLIRAISIAQDNENLRFPFPASLNLTEDLIGKFEAMHIPKSSSLELLSWTKHNFKITEDEIKVLLVRGTYCLPPCMDWGDLGHQCCPW